MKHKHAELIKAWADGAEIQVYNQDWLDCFAPSWCDYLEYRIKPEPKPDEVRYVACDAWLDEYDVSSSKYDAHNLKLTFDGETGQLKKVEVL